MRNIFREFAHNSTIIRNEWCGQTVLLKTADVRRLYDLYLSDYHQSPEYNVSLEITEPSPAIYADLSITDFDKMAAEVSHRVRDLLLLVQRTYSVHDYYTVDIYESGPDVFEESKREVFRRETEYLFGEKPESKLDMRQLCWHPFVDSVILRTGRGHSFVFDPDGFVQQFSASLEDDPYGDPFYGSSEYVRAFRIPPLIVERLNKICLKEGRCVDPFVVRCDHAAVREIFWATLNGRFVSLDFLDEGIHIYCERLPYGAPALRGNSEGEVLFGPTEYLDTWSNTNGNFEDIEF